MARKRPTVADVRANKGKYQYTMIRVESWEELDAADKAQVDMVSLPPEMMTATHFRESPATSWATIAGMFRAMPKSIETSQLNMTVCNSNASRLLWSSKPRLTASLILKSSILCASINMKLLHF
jgi:hypothetical protein